MAESDLQLAVAKYLNAQERLRKTFVWFHPASLSPSRIYGSIVKSRGFKAGVPDCLLFAGEGKTVSIELKYKKGRISPEQQTFHEKLKFLGHPVYIVKSEYPHDAINQVEKILQKEGLV